MIFKGGVCELEDDDRVTVTRVRGGVVRHSTVVRYAEERGWSDAESFLRYILVLSRGGFLRHDDDGGGEVVEVVGWKAVAR